MACLKLLLSNALIIAVALAFSTDNDSKNNSCTAININLPTSLKHDLTFKIHLSNIKPRIVTSKIKKETNENEDRFSFSADNRGELAKRGVIYHTRYTIAIPINRQTKTICLHIINLEIVEAHTNLHFHHEREDYYLTPFTYLYNYEEQTVVLDFGNKLLSLLNTHQLDSVICHLIVSLTGDITDDQESNFFRTSYIDIFKMKKERHWLIAAGDFQATGALKVLSCWVESTIKWKRQIIIIISHEKKYTALSNVPMKRYPNRNTTDDTHRTEFHFTDEIPSYLLTFIVSDLPLLSSKYGMNMWGRQLVSLELKFAWDIVANVTFRSEEILSVTCPSIMYINHVALPGFRDEGMRSFGLDYYNEASIMYNKTLDTIACKVKVAQIVARKTVLLLLGNVTSLSSWSYTWLNEGIATFMGMYIVDQIISDFRMMDLFVVQIQHESLRLNSYYDVPLLVEINTFSDIKPLFSLPRFLKAPVFVRMLQHVITNKSFLLGLNLYFKRQLNIVKNHSSDTSKSTFDNFWIAMTTSFETTHVSEFDLKKQFDNWMVQRHYPVLIVKRDYNAKDMNYVIIQLLGEDKPYSNKWRIPVTYATKTNSNFTKTSPDYWLEPHILSLKVPLVSKNEWIIVNIQQAGYYRVNYDWKNWQLIADYLKFEDHTRIHVLNRAQIIDDSFYFLLTNQLRFYIFWELTGYLVKETDYIAWYPMFKVLEQMSWLLPYNQSMYFKIHMLYILNGLLDKIGYKESPFENSLTVSLRQEAAKWACIFDSSTCKETATKILIKHFSENKMQNILPGWKHWVYCNGLMTAELNEKTIGNKPFFWRGMFDHFITNFNLNVLEFFSCSKDVDTIKAYMTLLEAKISPNIYSRESNKAYIYRYFSLVAKHVDTNGLLDYFLKILDKLTLRNKISEIAVLTNIINHVYSTDQIDMIRNFINQYNSTKLNSYIPMLHRKLEIRLSEINKQVQYLQKIL